MCPYGYSFSCLIVFVDLIFFNKGRTTPSYYFYSALNLLRPKKQGHCSIETGGCIVAKFSTTIAKISAECLPSEYKRHEKPIRLCGTVLRVFLISLT